MSILGAAAAAAGATGTQTTDKTTGTDDAAAKAAAETAAAAAKAGEQKGTEGDAAKKEAEAAAKKAEDDALAKPFTELTQLKLPEGLKADEAAMKEFLPFAKELGFTAKQASALIKFSADQNALAAKSSAAAAEAATEKAVTTTKADKEIGGAKWDASMKFAGQVLNKFGGDGLREAIDGIQLADGSMLGDNVNFAKLLTRLGKASSEDTLGTGTGAGDGGNGAEKAAEKKSLEGFYNHPTSRSTLKF